MTNSKLLADLHDAHLVGIAYGEDRSIHIDCVTTSSEKRVLRLIGVVNFFCSGMLEGNIIESVEVVKDDDISAEDLKYFVEKEGRGQPVAQLQKRIRDQQLCVVLLSPSYGAELGCVCSEIVVS